MEDNSSMTPGTCCTFPNLSLAVVAPGDPAPPLCRNLPEPQDLWQLLNG
jgi:hypothetical protein